MKPTISVILPVYNGEKYLSEAIESVLDQNFKNFELIIINDGSTDNSLGIIKKFIINDSRIKLISRDNKGLVASLNEGISSARGSFIARMDADDICLPTRFEEQLAYMKLHNLDLCGSYVQVFNENRDILIRKYPENHENIIITSLFYNPFAHPASMIRRIVFESVKYEDELAEDYALWCKVILAGFKVGNLPKVLLKYREHDQQITKNKVDDLNISANNIASQFASKLGVLELEIVRNKEFFIIKKQRKKILDLANQLDDLIEKHGANINVKYNMLLWLYLKAQPKTPWLYYQYTRLTAQNKRNMSNEIILFMKSFLYLQPNSRFLSIIKKGFNKIFKS